MMEVPEQVITMDDICDGLSMVFDRFLQQGNEFGRGISLDMT
ncbi:MAG: hypothetical protein PUE98_02855 [Galactobacillus timonensis]|nr:hypothetical protein [Galactobacillus timonensis]MDD6599392.1 hypothetical protein [Galactobacillus timonensis]